MSKKILAALTLLVSLSATATEQVKIIWPFGPVAATNTYRNIIEQSNAAQSRYTFVLDFVTGGGGSIAVNTVAQSKTPALLAHSTSFFINPKTDSGSGYSVSDWRMIKHICNVPMAVASTRFRSFRELPRDRPITVGILGLGTTTHLVQQFLAETYPNMVAVPYKTSTAALTDVLGGHLDLTVTLPGDALPHVDSGRLTVLGVSGPEPLRGIATLASQGFANSEKLMVGYFIFAHRSANAKTVAEWQQAIDNIDSQALAAVARQISCQPVTSRPKDLDMEFDKIDAYWSTLINRSQARNRS